MFTFYDDIVSRIKEEPLWWLEGVPRYAPFAPHLATVYAHEVALVRTTCQSCGRRFDVASLGDGRSLEDQFIIHGEAIVGDPPAHSHCSGESMVSDQHEVLEYWKRVSYRWQRLPKYEGGVADPSVTFSGRRKTMLQLLESKGLTKKYDRAFAFKNERELSEVLTAAGMENAAYYARLLLARKQADELRRLASAQTSFTRHLD